ncbi:hypothetical protein QE374_002773 [Microbacterium sp. SORGH_AS428]|uniref:hypothetical protein n=1 Tax=Microbacterium sp. SORGH_AS_0428 TaxID=3041788 RepID=UPI0028596088|nr:hypothetical protein [Microbacterium sp. SORGH_AS_0428]MDR6200864.1 hypothetical protein [Microbacterium sp. SORGH_AS_0428]
MSRRPGRPRREYQIRVRAERRERPDYEKLARALLEHAAMQERARRDAEAANPEPDAPSEAKEASE